MAAGQLGTGALLLYLVVLLTTFTGWLFESVRGRTIWFFWVVPLLRRVAEGSPTGRALARWHDTLP